MCGIAGWFGPSPAQAARELAAMAGAIAHRGPDGEGVWHGSSVGFAHRRLAIIDLGSGHQPMMSHDRRYAIVFNGEIYNYRELRCELEANGCRFRTDSDTEVVIELFRLEDVGGFTRLRGMYAFALWDDVERRGVLGRDPYGIKPLFLSRQDGRLFFGSEAKAILAVVGRRQMDAAALHLLLNFRYLPGRRSLFEGIEQLGPGEVLEWNETRCRQHAIALPRPAEVPVRSLLEQAVRRHLVADVEVGGYLSGGLDSGAICALAARETDRTFRTFTLPVGDDPDEARNAAETARLLGIANIRGEPARHPEEDLTRLVWHLETPKVNSWQVYRLARHARAHVKVAVSGLGGDELFYGYNAHGILAWLAATAGIAPGAARPAGHLLAWLAARLGQPWNEPERAGLMLGQTGNWSRVYGLLRNVWDGPRLRERLYGPRMLDARLPDAFATLEAEWPADRDPVVAMARFEWRHKMVNDLLWQEDRASMAVGLEVRVPYLDVDLAETVRAMPRATLMPGGRKKAYFRSLVSELLPAPVLRRRKSGFQVDAPEFVGVTLAGAVREWLSEERLRRHGLFNPAFVRDVLGRPRGSGSRWHFFLIYLMMLTHQWVELFERESPAPAP